MQVQTPSQVQQKPPKPRIYWTIGAIVVTVIFVAMLIWLGYWSVQVSRDLAILQRDTTVDTKKKFDASLEIAKAIVGGIGTVATIAGGVVLFLNFRVANRNAEIAQKKLEQEIEKAKTDAKLAESRLTMERFSKAVDMMGSDKSIHLRLGGIYALESIALDSSDDSIDQNYRQVLEVLTAFVRENSPYPPKKQVEKESTRPLEPSDVVQSEAIPPLRTDIQAALTVLNRRKHKDNSGEDRLDLSKTDLRKADLLGANLQRTNLVGANLQRASLYKADLQGAWLSGADLQGADLWDVNLQGAWLEKANLQGANLRGANLQSGFWEANLQGADLRGANLKEALLWKANLQKTDFRGANLQETDLRSCLKSI